VVIKRKKEGKHFPADTKFKLRSPTTTLARGFKSTDGKKGGRRKGGGKKKKNKNGVSQGPGFCGRRHLRFFFVYFHSGQNQKKEKSLLSPWLVCVSVLEEIIRVDHLESGGTTKNERGGREKIQGVSDGACGRRAAGGVLAFFSSSAEISGLVV